MSKAVDIKDTGKYQLLPDLPVAEFEALKADIAERGVVVPIDIDEDGEILDGHTRFRAWRELNKNEPPPTIVHAGLEETDKRAFARKNNILRRHLTREQIRTLVAAQLKETPIWADNRIAKEIGVDGKTVENVRGELLSTSEIPKFDRLIGTDGKYRPAKQPRRRKADNTDNDNKGWFAGHDPKAVDALPDEVKLAFFKAGISKDTVIVMPTPLWNPASDFTDAQLREWERFADFLAGGCAKENDGVLDHIEWIWGKDFKTPDEWLGEEGEKFRAKWRMHQMPAAIRESWESFKLGAAESP